MSSDDDRAAPKQVNIRRASLVDKKPQGVGMGSPTKLGWTHKKADLANAFQ